MSALEEAALDYAANGWSVFPAHSSGAKKSHKAAKYSNGRAWGATTDAEEIRRDFRKWPQANIGLPTGMASGFFVVEADTVEGHDVDGIASLRELEAKHGPLPQTRIAISPSGSVHYYFKYPTDGTTIINSTSEIGPGIDVRGEGGMVVAPPSVRPGKGPYRWSSELPIAEPPQWLLDRIAAGCRADDGERKSEPRADPARVARALAVIPNNDLDWERWNRIGMAAWHATGGAGFDSFDKWSRKSAKYDSATTRDRWDHYPKSPPTDVGAGTLFHMANQATPGWDAGVSLDDFVAYMPQHVYIFKPTGEPWPAGSVNARLRPIPLSDVDGKPKTETGKDGKPKQKHQLASVWLDQNKPVEQMTWAPGEPQLIQNRLIADGGWVERAGLTSFNLYRPPIVKHGDRHQAQRWVDHVGKGYKEDADHILKWLAQRVQQPGTKVNHALFLGGAPGIGKDTLLEPVKYAVGHWNFREVSPQNLLEPWNDYVKSVILRVNEARDLGDLNRYQLYEHMKVYCAAPPDVLRCNEKHLRQYSVQNCCAPLITSNYKTDGIYLPPTDRRTYVAWSDLTKDDFSDDYWNDLWGWYRAGGINHVAAYLAELDISEFDPKAPPPKTQAFWDIVDANLAPEDAELADVIDAIGKPDALTLDQLCSKANESRSSIYDWLEDRKNRRAIPHRLEQCGYVRVGNPTAESGLYVICGRRQNVYAKAELPVTERHAAASKLVATAAPKEQGLGIPE
jgi:hypothetical protein